MKKFILIAVALVVAAGCGVDLVHAYNTGTYGYNADQAVGDPATAPRVYRLVRYAENKDADDGTFALSAGEVVALDCVSDDGVTVGRVGSAKAGSTDAVVGVVVDTIQTADNSKSAANSIGSRNWGYVQVYGLNTDCQVLVSTTGVAGAAIAASPTASYAEVYQDGSATGKAGAIFGFTLDSVTSTATDNEVFIIRR